MTPRAADQNAALAVAWSAVGVDEEGPWAVLTLVPLASALALIRLPRLVRIGQSDGHRHERLVVAASKETPALGVALNPAAAGARNPHEP